MKYILILLMLVSTFCYGQKKDNIGKDESYDHNYLNNSKTINQWKISPFVGEPYGQKDSIIVRDIIHQQIFFSFGVYHLLTSDGSLYDNVIHGTVEFIEANRIVEFNKALQRRKPIVVVTAKCKP